MDLCVHGQGKLSSASVTNLHKAGADNNFDLAYANGMVNKGSQNFNQMQTMAVNSYGQTLDYSDP